MILKFRDDHIAQLKKELQNGQRAEPEEQIRQLQEEIRLLRDQVSKCRSAKYSTLSCCHVLLYIINKMFSRMQRRIFMVIFFCRLGGA